MKKLTENEMKNTIAGDTLTMYCNNCLTSFSADYWGWSGISFLCARAVVGNKLSNHYVDCVANSCSK